MKTVQKNKISTRERVRPALRHLVRSPEVRFILRYLQQYPRLFVLTVLFTGLGAALEGVGIGLLIPFVESLTSPEGEPWRTGWTWFDLHVLRVEADTLARLYWISSLILGSILLRAGFGYAAQYVSVGLIERIVARMRRDLIDHYQAVSLQFFQTRKTGQLLNALTSDISRIKYLFGTSNTILINAAMMLVYASAIVALSWQLSLIALLLCALLFVVMTSFLERLKRGGREVPEANAALVSVTTELLHGIRTVVTLGTQRYEARRFKTANDHVADLSTRLSRWNGMVGPISQGIASSALIAIVIVAVQFFVLPGHMTAAMLLAFLFAIFRLLPIIQTLNGLRGQWAVQLGSLETIMELLSPDGKPYLPDGHRDLHALREGVELRGVHFGYEPGQRVLEDVNLRIAKGQITALIGASGSGKSTLANLVARLYDPTQGQVLIDGLAAREYRIEALRRTICMVSQDTFLFNTSVRDNIAYGLPDVPEETVIKAAREANALEFIEELPEGFDTLLGERGTRLSGGQRQRIAIARALLRNPELLILDEATSALDSVSERLVQDALERLMQGRTVLIIAHRLATIDHADYVVVLEDGRIHEEGPREELLDRQGKFWEYYSMQFQLT